MDNFGILSVAAQDNDRVEVTLSTESLSADGPEAYRERRRAAVRAWTMRTGKPYGRAEFVDAICSAETVVQVYRIVEISLPKGTAEVFWDVDEGVVVLGGDIEVKTSEPMQIVNYLRSLGVPVAYTDHDQDTVEFFGVEAARGVCG